MEIIETYALEFFVQTTPPRETPATPTSGLYIERQNKIDPVLGVSRSQLVPEETFKKDRVKKEASKKKENKGWKEGR